jgi:hypothetical protein
VKRCLPFLRRLPKHRSNKPLRGVALTCSVLEGCVRN